MLKHREARTIAESLWGRGGTMSYKTNREGTFYFSCAGHGGYVIDLETLHSWERANVLRYLPTHEWMRFTSPRANAFHYEGKTRRTVYYTDSVVHKGLYIVAEEDCDWTAIDVLTSIRATDGRDYRDHVRAYHASRTFARWIRPLQQAA